MTNPTLSHPTEEALERFLLRRSDEQELEVVETHILACDACVTRLEALETQIADLNLAFEALEREQTAAARNRKQSFRLKWFTIPNLSWAGACCAALAAAFVIVPATLHSTRNSPAAESISACAAASGMDLTACRGKESALLPANRALNLTVATTDIAPGPADAQVVDATGRELWHGRTTVDTQQAKISVPAIAQPGTYLLRLYAPSVGVERELLREFRFEVK
jgi:anti-sigma factor RsiW